MFRMRDEAGGDDKVLCVPAGDPRLAHMQDIDDISDFHRLEIQHFFEVYKDLEPGKSVEGAHWVGRARPRPRSRRPTSGLGTPRTDVRGDGVVHRAGHPQRDLPDRDAGARRLDHAAAAGVDGHVVDRAGVAAVAVEDQVARPQLRVGDLRDLAVLVA